MKKIYRKPLIEVFDTNAKPVLYAATVDRGTGRPNATAKPATFDIDDPADETDAWY